jgi:predicted nicotinamide N-methyase
MQRGTAGIETFILANLRLTPVPVVPEVCLYLAHSGSGLSRLEPPAHGAGASPYWAYAWPGGAALARYVLDNPRSVAGRRVLDLGSGSGLVAIAACKAGAAHVAATEVDANALAAIQLNIAANGVAVEILAGDLLAATPRENVGVILAGDVFYGKEVAARMTPYLSACRQAGIDVLVGDPGRPHLPHDRLTQLASYAVRDFGMAMQNRAAASHVFRFD